MSVSYTSYGVDLSNSKIITGYNLTQSLGAQNNFQGQAVISFVISDDDRTNTSIIPALKTPYSSGSPYVLVEKTEKKKEAGLWEVTLTYQTVNSGTEYDGTGATTPADSFVESIGYEEESLALHPDFNSWSTGWDYEKEIFTSGPKIGESKYLTEAITVTKTEYYSTLPAFQSGVGGKLETPDSGRYGSADYWLCIGAQVGESNGWFTIVKTYKYSAKKWDTDFYSYA